MSHLFPQQGGFFLNAYRAESGFIDNLPEKVEEFRAGNITILFLRCRRIGKT
jgi:hypothetical protein